MSIWFEDYDHTKPALLDQLNALARETADSHLGIRLTEIGDDFVRGTVPVDQRTCQPFGLLHGGVSVVLAESLGSVAANLCINPATSMCVGIDINASHVRAVRSGTVTGTARPFRIGRSTQVWGIELENDQQQLSCVARLTIAVIARQT